MKGLKESLSACITDNKSMSDFVEVCYQTGVADGYRQALSTIKELGIEPADKLLQEMAGELEASVERITSGEDTH